MIDQDGKTLWNGLASREATRFGRSYQAENYYEVLSDAVVNFELDAAGRRFSEGDVRARYRANYLAVRCKIRIVLIPTIRPLPTWRVARSHFWCFGLGVIRRIW